MWSTARRTGWRWRIGLLEEGMKMMEKELGELREKVNSVENKREPFNDQGETECLEVVKKERKHLEV